MLNDLEERNAIQKAQVEDLLWFEENPGRRFRLREAHSHERMDLPSGRPPHGKRWRIIVTKAGADALVYSVASVPELVVNDDASE